MDDSYQDKISLLRLIKFIERKYANDFKAMNINEKMKKYEKELNERNGYNDFNKEDIDNLVLQRCSAVDLSAVFETKHEKWVEKENITFQYWDRYELYLTIEKHRSMKMICEIRDSTLNILDHCGNPRSSKDFDIRGLVIGDIQSGKTANYTGLINRAFDAGYKFIIVLAGTTNDLRAQTQKRLDKEVLGCETKPNCQKGVAIGVGLPKFNDDFPSKFSFFCLTDSSEDGDMRRFRSTVGIGGETPTIAIIKKNVNALENIIDFIQNNSAVKNTLDKKLQCPIMIIDDEADLASINTSSSENIDEATTINRLIRTIMNLSKKVSYVGYTATPFANVFIPSYNAKNEEDKDIFPKDFIIALHTPDDYDGVEKYFSIDGNDEKEPVSDLYYKITDKEIIKTYDVFSKSNKSISATAPKQLPDSLHTALKFFLLSSGVKVSRNIREHNSMLIHIDSHINYNKCLTPLVQEEFETIVSSFRFDRETRLEFRELWENYFKKISKNRLGECFVDTWEKIEKGIEECIFWFDENRANVVKLLNGGSSDVIDYDASNHGMHIIIGGNKLSRGLTLEGLIISYYYRNSRAYDTLLQMGRWFGYKNNWLDLCRVFTTPKIYNDFINTSLALESFKKDIIEMNDLSYTPMQFGQKVKTSPKLLPTAITKLKHAEKGVLSFSGVLQQTLNYDPNINEYNRKSTSIFFESLAKKYPYDIDKKTIIFRNVPVNDLLKYLESYKESEDNGTNLRISVALWVRYIKKLIINNELLYWTIVLSSLNESKYNGTDSDQIGPFNIFKSSRSRNVFSEDDGLYHIRVLTNPADFNEFFTENDPLKKLIKSYNPVKNRNDVLEAKVRNSFSSDKGLISIYDFDYREHSDTKESGQVIGSGIIGLGLWFPISKDESNSNIEYYFNDVYVRRQKEDYEEEKAGLEE